MGRKTKKYHKSYRLDEDHQYKYMGDYYDLPLAEGEKNKILIHHFIFLLCIISLLLLGGLLNNRGSRSFFLMVPYAFLFLPAVYLAMGIFYFRQVESRMELAAYDKSIARMIRCYRGLFYLSLYLCAGDALFLIQGGAGEELVPEIVFLFICFLLFVISLKQGMGMKHLAQRVVIQKKQGESPD